MFSTRLIGVLLCVIHLNRTLIIGHEVLADQSDSGGNHRTQHGREKRTLSRVQFSLLFCKGCSSESQEGRVTFLNTVDVLRAEARTGDRTLSISQHLCDTYPGSMWVEWQHRQGKRDHTVCLMYESSSNK